MDATQPSLLAAMLHSCVLPLVRLVMSLPPSSASVERAFSTTGRVNAPVRNRLGDEMIEALTVVKFYITKYCKTSPALMAFAKDVVGFCA